MMSVHTLEELYGPVRSELDEVQTAVNTYWHEVLSIVDDSAVPQPKVGGKLMRPALCLLAAGATGVQDLRPFVPVAAAFELLHIAALVHDDVIDKASLRRGTLSLNAQWDDRRAVLSGDYLVARATQLLVATGSCPLIENAFEAVRCMTYGELTSLGDGVGQYTQQDCIQLASQKTATLFAASCAATAHIGRAARFIDSLQQFGLALGIAFQLIDDILDITQTQSVLGKPACGDIAQQKKTLPILFMKETLQGQDRQRLDAMAGRPVSEDDRAWACALVQSSGALARTGAIAVEYAIKARSALDPLPASPFKDSMTSFTNFVIRRDA